MPKRTATDFNRVQHDLVVMQHALGVGYPYDRMTIVGWLGVATVSALGAMAAATSSVTLRNYTLAFGLALVTTVLVGVFRVRRMRAITPVAWREIKSVSVAKLIAGPPLLAFVVWQFLQGASGPYLVSTTAFWVGIITMIYATTQPWRKAGLGVALPLLFLGGIIPVMAPHRIALAVACAGVVAGLSCAAIVAIQMRSLATPIKR